MREQRDVLDADGGGDSGNQAFQVTSQQGLSARERDHQGVEEPRGVGILPRLVGAGVSRGLPVVAESAPRVTAERDLEVHQYRAPARREIRMLGEKDGHMPWREPRREHPYSIGRSRPWAAPVARALSQQA